MSPRAAARRLAKLEGSLSPRASVLLWLAEAHAFPTLPAYARSLIDRPEADWPLAQIGERVEAAVRSARQGETRKAVEWAVREQIRDAFFLFELVVAINLETVESVEREGLRLGLLTYQMRSLQLEGEIPQYRDHPYAGRPLAERWKDWREAVSGFMSGLYEAEGVRLLLERRYLDGHACLFPELAGDWETLLQLSTRMGYALSYDEISDISRAV